MSGFPFITLEDLKSWKTVSADMSPPARVAVIGDPISHSRSPQMHNPALEERGLNMQYVRVHVPVGSVKDAFSLLADKGFVGINCTIPHKFEALKAMDVVDDLAEKLGAVNTVAIREGKFYGYNSDGPGFLNSLKEAFGQPLEELKILVLGAGGGAGQAVALQTSIVGCRGLWLANRSVEKLKDLRARCTRLRSEMTINSLGLDQINDVIKEVDLIVNATPMGMKEEDIPLFDFDKLKPRHLVYDMVYRSTGETPLIATAKAAGSMTCDGLALLLHQGAISFKHWFGDPVPMVAMRQGLLTP